jgi:GMP synthase-like glutamine amidotransferase
MRVHVLQHVPFEGLGSIGPWLEKQEAKVSYTRFFASTRLPSPNAIDMVIIMGGPMSANNEDKLPWLVPEKQFIHDVVLRGVPVLGVCLGAQLIAAAMGARVYRNPVSEIGWFSVRRVATPKGNFAFPEECMVFHWHGETFDLPVGAVHIAESDGCKNQAFQLNRNAVGLQFHLETTLESVSALLDNCRQDLVSGPYIQSEAEIRAIPRSSYRAINDLMDKVLSYLINPS